MMSDSKAFSAQVHVCNKAIAGESIIIKAQGTAFQGPHLKFLTHSQKHRHTAEGPSVSEDEEKTNEEANEATEATSAAEESREPSEGVESLEYKVSSPELLQIMLDAFDILEQAEEGKISIDEAKAMYLEKVEDALKKAGESVRKKRRRASRGTKKAKKASSRRKRPKSARGSSRASGSEEVEGGSAA
jgi:hypothetical protein